MNDGRTDMKGMCLIMLIGIIVIAITGYTVYFVARQLSKKYNNSTYSTTYLSIQYI
ncbi:hypothetical protein G5B47_17375 [Paenibacillus sp. 7124]|uniref:Uncharacterized protein n=1 Tax=Paenibacillus apii TaxID=1850370 RepID=A0A6M1PKP2_9BACL|nr:hypothetical protein [Paenibacillus apii]NGM84187.1 hypothetical protein [Paenibacillus apii]NJJ40917.1 hypothetical protein [Paenibacillus apii]